MRDKYGANERSQKLKYHIQTSGRSLHTQEMSFNDIRTTLQPLIALYDHCNSLHTNAYDEAITTPIFCNVRTGSHSMCTGSSWITGTRGKPGIHLPPGGGEGGGHIRE